MKGIHRIVIAAAAVIFAPVAVFTLLDLSNWSLFEKDTFEFSGEEARQEYEARMASFFQLPNEAQVLRLKREDDWVDQNFWLTFRLPESKPSEKWLQEIWESNKFAKGSRESRLVYSAYHWEKPDDHFRKHSKLHHGWREIRFDPEKRLYTAIVRTD